MDLYKYLDMYCDRLTESSIRDIFKKIVEAVKYCHDHNIMHRDLKPENILVNVDREGLVTNLKLADFGQASKIYKNTVSSSYFGTRGYIAPEALNCNRQFDQKIDSWSLGIILYNLVCGAMPFRGSEKKIKYQTLNKVP